MQCLLSKLKNKKQKRVKKQSMFFSWFIKVNQNKTELEFGTFGM